MTRRAIFLKFNVLLSSALPMTYEERPRTNEKSAAIKGSAFH